MPAAGAAQVTGQTEDKPLIQVMPKTVSDARFYAMVVVTLMVLVVALMVLPKVGISEEAATQFTGIVGGFTTLMIFQYRQEVQRVAVAAERDEAIRVALENSNAESARRDAEVKRLLAVSTAEAGRKAEEVKKTLEVVAASQASELADIKAVGIQTQVTGRATHTLVNSEHGIALRSNETLARRIYEDSGKAEDKVVMDAATAILREHELKQGVVDAQQEKNRIEGKPTA